jgi:hypothetical protein
MVGKGYGQQNRAIWFYLSIAEAESVHQRFIPDIEECSVEEHPTGSGRMTAMSDSAACRKKSSSISCG